jgi:hypothetical protein
VWPILNTDSLPNPAPLVIEDAIIATKIIGFRHLWIDRYCISQTNLEDQEKQIEKMVQIYARAEVTLVAVAGEGHYRTKHLSKRMLMAAKYIYMHSKLRPTYQYGLVNSILFPLIIWKPIPSMRTFSGLHRPPWN